MSILRVIMVFYRGSSRVPHAMDVTRAIMAASIAAVSEIALAGSRTV